MKRWQPPWQWIGAAMVCALVFATFAGIQGQVNERQVSRDKSVTFSTERKEASAERKMILEALNDLQRKYDNLLTQQRNLLIWLRDNGIEVPPELIDQANSDLRVDSDDDDSDGGSNGGSVGNGASKSGATTGRVTTAKPTIARSAGAKDREAGNKHDKGNNGKSHQDRGGHGKKGDSKSSKGGGKK